MHHLALYSALLVLPCPPGPNVPFSFGDICMQRCTSTSTWHDYISVVSARSPHDSSTMAGPGRACAHRASKDEVIFVVQHVHESSDQSLTIEQLCSETLPADTTVKSQRKVRRRLGAAVCTLVVQYVPGRRVCSGTAGQLTGAREPIRR